MTVAQVNAPADEIAGLIKDKLHGADREVVVRALLTRAHRMQEESSNGKLVACGARARGYYGRKFTG
jgi:hypothetical protein